MGIDSFHCISFQIGVHLTGGQVDIEQETLRQPHLAQGSDKHETQKLTLHS